MPAVNANSWENWSGNQQQPEKAEVVRPANVAQLRKVMVAAAREKKKIRPIGTAHGWAELIVNEKEVDGHKTFEPVVIIDLRRWEGDLVLDRGDDTATLPTGWRLDEAEAQLAQEGYQINSPPVYEKMNVGGLIGTASHGTGDGKTETMSDHVVGFKMMLPNGTIVSVDKDDDLDVCQEELLRAVRCSMGVLGVVYEVTLRVTPLYMVRERDFLVPVQEGLDKLEGIVNSNMFVEMFWVPFAKDLWFKAYNRTNPVHRFRLSSIYYWLRDKSMFLFQMMVYPGMLARRAPKPEQYRARRMLVWLARLLRIMMGDRVVPARAAFHFQKTLPKIIALAFIVRRSEIVELWRYLMARVRDQEIFDLYPTNIMVESRFINRSEETKGRDTPKLTAEQTYVPSILLSPAVFDETAYVELVGYAETEGMIEFFEAVERGVNAHFPEARPHWGKYFKQTEGTLPNGTPWTLASRYNKNPVRDHYRMTRFLKIREALDPDHAMSNEFMDKKVLVDDPAAPNIVPKGQGDYLNEIVDCDFSHLREPDA
jgi:L-gulonolactone oxidase